VNQVARLVLIVLPLLLCSLHETSDKKGWLLLNNNHDTIPLTEAEYRWNIFGVGKLKIVDEAGKKHKYRANEVKEYYFKNQHFIFIPFYGNGTEARDLVLMESLIYNPKISYYQSFAEFEGIPNDYIVTENYTGFIADTSTANKLKATLENCKAYKAETDPFRMEREQLEKNINLYNHSCP